MDERKKLKLISSVEIMNTLMKKAAVYSRRDDLSRLAHSIRRSKNRKVVDDA